MGSRDDSSLAEDLLDLTVEHEHKGRADGTESVGTSTLEEGASALLGEDGVEAVHGASVLPLSLGLVGLHLETAADGIEGVGDVGGAEGGGLGTEELGHNTADGGLLLVRVEAVEGVVHTEVGTTEGEDTNSRDTKAVVERENTTGALGGLDKAVNEAVELLLALTDIGGKAGTGVVKGVDKAEGTNTGKTTRGNVDHEELVEVLLGGVLGEDGLDGVLEGKVKGLGGEVTDDVHTVASPEGLEALLLEDTGEGVTDGGVTGHLTADDAGVGILGLDDELDTLDGSSASLGNGARDTAGQEVDNEVGLLLLATHFGEVLVQRINYGA